MVSIIIEGKYRRIVGKNITRDESFAGIGEWSGYSALLIDCDGGNHIVLTGNPSIETHTIIDSALHDDLDDDEREAVCLHYGLMCRGKKRDLSKTTTALNKIYGCFHDKVYHDGEVNKLINSAIEKLTKDENIQELIKERTSSMQGSSAAP